MKKLKPVFYLYCLLLLFFLSACSTTKYGAHFQSSPDRNYVLQEEDKPLNNDPAFENEPEAEEEHWKENDLQKEIEGVASLKQRGVELQLPKAEDLTVRQQKVLKEVQERLGNMSRKEKRELRRQVKKIRLEEYTQDLPLYKSQDGTLGMNGLQQDDPDTNTLLLLIITILVPPLGVFLHQGEINTKFWVSLVLTLLFYIPGLIYSLIVIFGD